MRLRTFADALIMNVLVVSVNGSSYPFLKVGRNPTKSIDATATIAHMGFEIKKYIAMAQSEASRHAMSNLEIFFVPNLKDRRKIKKQNTAPIASAQAPYPAPSFS